MQYIKRVSIAASAMAIFLNSAAETPDGAQSLSSDQRIAMQLEYPGSEVVSQSDIDEKSCKPAQGSPSYVTEDFDGDGHKDFSVLAGIGKPGKLIEWQGQQLRHQRFVFAIFLADSKGKYHRRLAREFESYKPLGAILKIQSAGQVIDRDSGKPVAIEHPGVVLAFCEKSAAIYFYSRGRFRTVQLID
jgi:hypothetical protein